MIYFIIVLSGLIIGSFLNVCIYRLPRNQSIVFPNSRCTSCNRPIPWYDNIPLLSYILLKGKCRFCKEKISFRYFVVEFLTAIIFLVVYLKFGITLKFWIYCLLACSFIVVSFIDQEFQIIPDVISLPGIVSGIMLSIVVPGLHNVSGWKAGLLNSFFGILAGGGLIYLTGFLGKMIFKKESMGGGDVKLMAMIGAFLGWRLALLTFFLAPFFGTPIGLYLKFVKKEDIIPYGPYLSIAGFISMIWGYNILRFFIL